MAIDNLNNENMPLASASLPQSEEHGFDLLNNDSAYLNEVASDYNRNDMPISLPLVSMSPPHWNVPGISQYHSREIVPAGGNLLTYSSQINSSKNVQTCDHYLLEEDHKSLLHRPDSDFWSPNGYGGQPYQYNNQDYLTISDKMMNVSFNLNSSEKLDGGRKVANDNNSSAGGPQVLKPSAKAINVNIGQPPLNLNFGTPQFSPNQGGVSLNCPGKLGERYMTFGSESNTETKVDSNISGINITGNSKREFIPPINAHHAQMGSRSFFNPGFDMNDAFSGFQSNNEVVSDLPLNVGAWMHSIDDHKVMFDTRPGVGLGPLYDFQRPAAGDQIHCLRPVNMDLGLGGGKDIGMEIADVSQKNGSERCMAFSSLPLVGGQIMQCDIGQSKASEQIVFSSPGMISNQSLSRQLLENNVNSDGKFSSQFSTPPFSVATGSTRGQDPSSNQGQSQVVGSIQQSNTPHGSVLTSDLGIQTGMENMTAQVSGPCVRSSRKRGASEPQSSTIQVHRRKTLRTHPFIHPSVPTWARSIPLVPNTSQTIPPLIHRATSLTPQVTNSIVHPSIPALTKSALSAPNISQTIPPIIRAVPSLSPQVYATVPLPLHDKRMPSFLPSSQIVSVPHQPQIAQSLPHPRWRPPIIPSAPAPKIAPVHIKYKDAGQTPELIGHKCLLCKRDLSFTPEGPIFQPSPPPAASVLPCGHTFHNHCLERITPEDQSKDPPCIPCALRG